MKSFQKKGRKADYLGPHGRENQSSLRERKRRVKKSDSRSDSEGTLVLRKKRWGGERRSSVEIAKSIGA